MAGDDLAAGLERLIRPGDTLWWGQAGAEPLTLVQTLLQHRLALAAGGRLRVFVGIGSNDALRPEHADAIDFFGYSAAGTHRALARAGVLDILPAHYSQLPGLLRQGRLAADVVLLQVSPPDAHGRHSLGQAVEYLPAAIARARVLVGEVHPDVPWTHGGLQLRREDFALLAASSAPLPLAAAGPPGEVEQAIAAHVAGLVEDGATLQVGVGKLPEAVLARLRDRRDLGLHSGVVGDGIALLAEAGALTNARKTVDPGVGVGGILIGSDRVRRWAHRNPALALRGTEHTHDPEVLARSHKLAAINAALEVDLTGQVNAEVAGGVYLGAVGGAVDFLRGAARSHGGLPIVALPSASKAGSHIVARLNGPVSTARSDAGIVVTEHGVADLRGLTLSRRVRRMLALAAPAYRADLEREAHALLRQAGAVLS